MREEKAGQQAGGEGPGGGPSLDPTQAHSLSELWGRAGPVRPPAAPEAPYVQPRGLRVERRGAPPLEMPLYADRTYVFGRSTEAHLVLPDRSISRLHGMLSFSSEGRWVYRDLSSRNGSFLSATTAPPAEGPEPVSRIWPERDVPLRPGESVVLAHVAGRIVLTLEPPPSSPAPPAGGGERSRAARQLEEAVALNARHRLPVFLLGPSGSGKTHTARAIHDASGVSGPFVLINCGRLPEDAAALTSELLGHKKGAFTQALSDRLGKLHYAHGGTLFLDEVESLPPRAQQFLLDVLEGSGSFLPLGAPPDLVVPRPRFRLLAASKVALHESGLRPDLAQRLATGTVVVLPGLEERREDIPRLVAHFLERLAREQQVEASFDAEALAFLQQAPWPGQVRELEATVVAVTEMERLRQEARGGPAGRVGVGRAALAAHLEERARGFGAPRAGAAPSLPSGDGPLVVADPLPPPPPRRRPAEVTRAEAERVLAAHGGNKTHAARALGISVNTLKARLRGT